MRIIKRRKAKRYYKYLFIAIAAVLLTRFGKAPEQHDEKSDGNTAATELTDGQQAASIELPAITSHDTHVLRRTNYVVSFNTETNLPNWVAWDITAQETQGELERESKFYKDPDVVEHPVLSSDYSKSGYDRGHMCPAADNRYNEQAMKESFYMTNICPQDRKLNAGKWNDLETACRRWAKQYGRVYVACGPIVDDQGMKQTIGKENKIAVPKAFFKVVLLTDEHSTRAIGYIFGNDNGDNPQRTCSVDEVERLTGLDFFCALPDSIEEAVESTFDARLWSWYKYASNKETEKLGNHIKE